MNHFPKRINWQKLDKYGYFIKKELNFFGDFIKIHIKNV